MGGRASAVPGNIQSARERVPPVDLDLYHGSEGIASDRKPSRIRQGSSLRRGSSQRCSYNQVSSRNLEIFNSNKEKRMAKSKEIRNVTIVGTGVLGASWAAYYLCRGLDEIATDPAPNAEASLRKYVDEAWTLCSSAGLKLGASRDRRAFTTRM